MASKCILFANITLLSLSCVIAKFQNGVSIHESTLSDELKNEAVDIVREALNTSEDWVSRTNQIEAHFEHFHGAKWRCSMGDSGFSAAEAAGYELWKNAFLNFTVDNVDVFLFQWNPDSASILELERNGTILQSRMSKIHSTFDDVQVQFDKVVSSTTAYLLQLQGDKSTLSQAITALEASFKTKQDMNSKLSESVANKMQEHEVCSKQMSDHLETKRTLDSTTLELYDLAGDYVLIKHECNRNYADVSQENARLSAELSSLQDSLTVENQRQEKIMKVLLEEFTNGSI